MEAAALGEWMEEAAERLIPPAAREAVLGDLRETCAGGRAYLIEILKTAPFVIVSQMLRHLNLPVLMLQAALIFWFFSGWAVMLCLPVLLLREAYQPLTRPDARLALRNAMRLSFAGLFLGLITPIPARQALVLALLAGPFSLLLCGLRTGLILNMDRYEVVLPGAMKFAELSACRKQFLARLVRRRRLEIAALVLAALGWPLVMEPSLGIAMGAVFLAAALYLIHLDLSSREQGEMDFRGLRHRYAEDLRGDEQLRRFLCWLWVVPGLGAAHAGFVTGGPPEQIASRALLAILLCFGAGAINREERGRAQEEISLLGRLREQPSILA
jgi:hypothetical protein